MAVAPDTHDLAKVRRRISEAAFAPELWEDALLSAAYFAGGDKVQLVGFGPAGPTFDRCAGADPVDLIEFEKLGGLDPTLNPKIAPALSCPVLSTVTEADFISQDDRRRNFFYNEVFDKYGTYFSCMSKLIGDADLTVILAITRSESGGDFDPSERTQLSHLTMTLQSAARLQLDKENYAAVVAAHALDSLGAPAFVCDVAGRVTAMSPAAEDMVRQGDLLRLRQGRLACCDPRDSDRLWAAIAATPAYRFAYPGKSTSLIIGARAQTPVRVDVIQLSSTLLPLGARASSLVVIKAPSARPAPPLTALGLTDAEAEVARLLYEGLAPAEIAEQRAVSASTIRSQTKAIYAKLGVSRFGEFVSLVRNLL